MRIINSGDIFGELTTVQKVAGPRRGEFWLCRCSCGDKTLAYSGHLRAGMRVSCGCKPSGPTTHNMSGSAEYKAWDNARNRCYSPNNRKYPLYGGRGISMCDRWRLSFENFIADMGRKPTPQHSLDRINRAGNYEPENCRWATIIEQNNNRCFNRHLNYLGMRVTVAEASRITGIPHATILGRLDAGKTDEEAIRAIS